MSDPDERGMILINVLMFVAIASGMVALMITREEAALDRSLRVREAARAMAAVRGGELTALVALRRDGLTAPDIDSAAEPWAALAESGAPIEGGRFDLAVGDAQARFNVNMLRSGEAAPAILFQQVARSAGLDDAQTVQAIALVRLAGPFTDLRPLRLAGLAPETLSRLESLVTALPGETSININAATPAILSVLFPHPLVAERLIALRERNRQITPKDLQDQSVSLPPGASFASKTFWVRTRATIGDTVQQGATLIQRRTNAQGRSEAVPVERWLNAAVPPDAPAFDTS